MPHSVNKGNRLQVAARKLLESDGYAVHTAVRSVQRLGPPGRQFWFSQNTDIFNAFDLIATRMEGPRPLRFIQVTTENNVSERVKKVDPVPISPAIASVEVWAWHGGQKRLDRRFKAKKVWLPRNYFQIYFKERNWEAHQDDRVFVGEPVPAAAKAEAKPSTGAAPVAMVSKKKPQPQPR